MLVVSIGSLYLFECLRLFYNYVLSIVRVITDETARELSIERKGYVSYVAFDRGLEFQCFSRCSYRFRDLIRELRVLSGVVSNISGDISSLQLLELSFFIRYLYFAYSISSSVYGSLSSINRFFRSVFYVTQSII